MIQEILGRNLTHVNEFGKISGRADQLLEDAVLTPQEHEEVKLTLKQAIAETGDIMKKIEETL